MIGELFELAATPISEGLEKARKGGGRKTITACSANSTNANPRGLPREGPDLWKRKSREVIVPNLENRVNRVYLHLVSTYATTAIKETYSSTVGCKFPMYNRSLSSVFFVFLDSCVGCLGSEKGDMEEDGSSGVGDGNDKNWAVSVGAWVGVAGIDVCGVAGAQISMLHYCFYGAHLEQDHILVVHIIGPGMPSLLEGY